MIFFECPVCGKEPKVGFYPPNIGWAKCTGYAFHHHKKIQVSVYDQPSTLYQTLCNHWNQIQFREARFLYNSEEDIAWIKGKSEAAE